MGERSLPVCLALIFPRASGRSSSSGLISGKALEALALGLLLAARLRRDLNSRALNSRRLTWYSGPVKAGSPETRSLVWYLLASSDPHRQAFVFGSCFVEQRRRGVEFRTRVRGRLYEPFVFAPRFLEQRSRAIGFGAGVRGRLYEPFVFAPRFVEGCHCGFEPCSLIGCRLCQPFVLASSSIEHRRGCFEF